MEATPIGLKAGRGSGAFRSSPRQVARVPGQACPGDRARRRAVERPTKAGVPVARCESRFSAATDSHSPSPPRRLGMALSTAPVAARRCSAEMEVIRDQFRLYVWAAVSSFRKVRFLRYTQLLEQLVRVLPTKDSHRQQRTHCKSPGLEAWASFLRDAPLRKTHTQNRNAVTTIASKLHHEKGAERPAGSDTSATGNPQSRRARFQS
jgi:hypothetical protein